MFDLLDKLRQFLKDLGPETIAVVVAFILGVIATQLGKILNFLGKVIAWLYAKARGRKSDRAFEKDYLGWIEDEYRHLGLIPAQIIARKWGERQQFVELEDVYVNISVSKNSRDEVWPEHRKLNTISWHKRPWFGLNRAKYLARKWLPMRINNIAWLNEEIYHPGDLGWAIDRNARLIIRGDPGAGKTTVMRYLALTCARSLYDKEGRAKSRQLVKRRFHWDKRPFPILVTLRRHSNVVSWGDDRDMIDAFLDEIPPEFRKHCPNGFFERRLRKGSCLILCDAFDELGTPEARNHMARRITSFLEIYERSDNRIVITTRIVGYEGQLDRHSFVVRTVQKLEVGEIRALVRQRYKAINYSETMGRTQQESQAISRKLMRRAENLIEQIERAPRLGQLGSNPMLLSLIVLVHFLKVELPEERLLLYRDCVEILAERWQRVKQEEFGTRTVKENDITLTQKITLLYELALVMQERRTEDGSHSLISKNIALDVIAGRLADFSSEELTQSENTKKQVFLRKAVEWIDGIQTESGILVEQGLDHTGEILIGFPHLTFQEYLSAVALNQNPTYRHILWSNLLKPSWREVILLYVALVNDATPIIEALIESNIQPDGALLAGSCLAERVRTISGDVKLLTLTKISEYYINANGSYLRKFVEVMGTITGPLITAFMRNQLSNTDQSKRMAAIKVLGRIKADDPEIQYVREDLLQVVENEGNPEIRAASMESLAEIGDPRFMDLEPELVNVPPHSSDAMKPFNSIEELRSSKLWKSLDRNGKFYAITKVLEYLFYTKFRSLSRQDPTTHLKGFDIARFPITNIEYSRFIDDTGYRVPFHWKEGLFPIRESNHPIVGVLRSDADAYCKWLSLKTGKQYRIPTEWEWEIAARGNREWKYPWGNNFDKNKCNTLDSDIGKTTPVGTYLTGRSPYGLDDMVGNVWELTDGRSFNWALSIR